MEGFKDMVINYLDIQATLRRTHTSYQIINSENQYNSPLYNPNALYNPRH